MDQKATDELAGREAHDVLFVAILDAIVFPSERNGVGIGIDDAAI